MSLNKHQPYLRIIPEDKAIDQLAFKFIRKYFEPLQVRQIEREDFAGGFKGAEGKFLLLSQELKNENCHLLVLVDCDGQLGSHGRETRAESLLLAVEEVYRERVYILTFERESEDFLAKFDPPKNAVGDKLAELCLDPDHPKFRPQWDKAQVKHLIRPPTTVSRLKKILETLRK